jgi:hypothetical protein
MGEKGFSFFAKKMLKEEKYSFATKKNPFCKKNLSSLHC